MAWSARGRQSEGGRARRPRRRRTQVQDHHARHDLGRWAERCRTHMKRHPRVCPGGTLQRQQPVSLSPWPCHTRLPPRAAASPRPGEQVVARQRRRRIAVPTEYGRFDATCHGASGARSVRAAPSRRRTLSPGGPRKSFRATPDWHRPRARARARSDPATDPSTRHARGQSRALASAHPRGGLRFVGGAPVDEEILAEATALWTSHPADLPSGHNSKSRAFHRRHASASGVTNRCTTAVRSSPPWQRAIRSTIADPTTTPSA